MKIEKNYLKNTKENILKFKKWDFLKITFCGFLFFGGSTENIAPVQ